MAFHQGLMKQGFKLPQCEKHFHDHDETWLILAGQGTGYWLDHAGQRQEFALAAGDVWLIPAGYEHGSEGPNSADFTISVFNGTEPPGCHRPGHYYVEKEGYLPSFELKKTPTTRYRQAASLPAKIKGLVFAEKGRAVVQDEDCPTGRPGRVLAQTLFTGLTNGTERNCLVGGNYCGGWPGRCGYQNVGRILEVGLGVSGYAVGDLIFSGDFCQHRQFFDAPAGPDALLVKLPAAVNPQHAALFGVASVALHDVRRTELRLGERALVVGAGPIGQFTAQAARAVGGVVTVCDLDEHRLAVARDAGAHQTILLAKDDSWEAVRQAGPFDVVFEDSGAPILDQVIGASWGRGVLKPRSRVVMIAGRGRVDYSFNAGQSYELCIHHAGHFVADDLRQVCRLVAAGVIQVGPIIQDCVPFAQAIAIYDRLRDAPNSLFGTVFDWQ